MIQGFQSKLKSYELLDLEGTSYYARIRFSKNRATEAYLSKGWLRFVRDNHLKCSGMVKFRVLFTNEHLIMVEVVAR